MLKTERILKAFVVVILLGVLFMGRLFVVFVNHTNITDAIFVYQMECIRAHEPYDVTYDDAEDINRTLWRLWDFGRKRILPREKYAKIQKYIGVDYKIYTPDSNTSSHEELWAAIEAAMPSARGDADNG